MAIFPALFYFDVHDWFSDIIGEGSSAAVRQISTREIQESLRHRERVAETEALEQSVEKNLRLVFFIAVTQRLNQSTKEELFGARYDEFLREQSV